MPERDGCVTGRLTWPEWRARATALRTCASHRCGHDLAHHNVGRTVWGERLPQCDDCDPGEMAGLKWHAFEAPL